MRDVVLRACLAVLGCLAAAPHAVAEGDLETVLLLGFEVERDLSTQLTAELEGMGLRPLPIAAPASLLPSRSLLEDLTRSRGAAAAVWVTGVPEQRVVWVLLRQGRRTLTQTFPVSGSTDAGEVITAAAELVRTTLVKAEQRSAPARVPASPSEPGGAWRLTAGLGARTTYRTRAIVPSVTAGTELTLTDDITAVARGTIPMVSNEIAASQGKAFLRLWAGEGSLRATPVRMGRASLDVSLGLSVLRLTVDGRARAPYEGHVDTAWVLEPILALGFGFALTNRLELHVEAQLGWPLARPIIRFADEEVARWTRPSLGILIDLGVDLFQWENG